MATKKIESLTEIKEAVAATSAVAETKRKPSRDKQGRSYATGKRKNAVARVWIMPGKGNITINDKPIDTYFARPVLKMIINHFYSLTLQPQVFIFDEASGLCSGFEKLICSIAGEAVFKQKYKGLFS